MAAATDASPDAGSGSGGGGWRAPAAEADGGGHRGEEAAHKEYLVHMPPKWQSFHNPAQQAPAAPRERALGADVLARLRGVGKPPPLPGARPETPPLAPGDAAERGKARRPGPLLLGSQTSFVHKLDRRGQTGGDDEGGGTPGPRVAGAKRRRRIAVGRSARLRELVSMMEEAEEREHARAETARLAAIVSAHKERIRRRKDRALQAPPAETAATGGGAAPRLAATDPGRPSTRDAAAAAPARATPSPRQSVRHPAAAGADSPPGATQRKSTWFGEQSVMSPPAAPSPQPQRRCRRPALEIAREATAEEPPERAQYRRLVLMAEDAETRERIFGGESAGESVKMAGYKMASAALCPYQRRRGAAALRRIDEEETRTEKAMRTLQENLPDDPFPKLGTQQNNYQHPPASKSWGRHLAASLLAKRIRQGPTDHFARGKGGTSTQEAAAARRDAASTLRALESSLATTQKEQRAMAQLKVQQAMEKRKRQAKEAEKKMRTEHEKKEEQMRTTEKKREQRAKEVREAHMEKGGSTYNRLDEIRKGEEYRELELRKNTQRKWDDHWEAQEARKEQEWNDFEERVGKTYEDAVAAGTYRWELRVAAANAQARGLHLGSWEARRPGDTQRRVVHDGGAGQRQAAIDESVSKAAAAHSQAVAAVRVGGGGGGGRVIDPDDAEERKQRHKKMDEMKAEWAKKDARAKREKWAKKAEAREETTRRVEELVRDRTDPKRPAQVEKRKQQEDVAARVRHTRRDADEQRRVENDRARREADLRDDEAAIAAAIQERERPRSALRRHREYLDRVGDVLRGKEEAEEEAASKADRRREAQERAFRGFRQEEAEARKEKLAESEAKTKRNERPARLKQQAQRRAARLRELRRHHDEVSAHHEKATEALHDTLTKRRDQAAVRTDQIQRYAARMELFREAKFRGNTLRKQDRHADAVHEYTEALRRCPDEAMLPEVLCLRAAAFIRLGAYDEAEQDCQQALQSEPREREFDHRVKSITLLGAVYFHRKEFARARAEFERAQKVDPSSEEAKSGYQRLEQAAAAAKAAAKAAEDAEKAGSPPASPRSPRVDVEALRDRQHQQFAETVDRVAEKVEQGYARAAETRKTMLQEALEAKREKTKKCEQKVQENLKKNRVHRVTLYGHATGRRVMEQKEKKEQERVEKVRARTATVEQEREEKRQRGVDRHVVAADRARQLVELREQGVFISLPLGHADPLGYAAALGASSPAPTPSRQ